MEAKQAEQVDGHGTSGDVVPRVLQKARSADDKLVTFVRERPLVALATALAAGYVLGRVISRLG